MWEQGEDSEMNEGRRIDRKGVMHKGLRKLAGYKGGDKGM
jgi:hypothetical protein